jgi:hypothetical protein
LLLMQDQLRVTPRLCLTVVHPDGECLAELSWFISRSLALQLRKISCNSFELRGMV